MKLSYNLTTITLSNLPQSHTITCTCYILFNIRDIVLRLNGGVKIIALYDTIDPQCHARHHHKIYRELGEGVYY